jgi:uncharacterized membrane protein
VEYEISVNISAPADEVWAAMIDVERWPEFIASVVSAHRLDSGPMRIGAQARIKQPGFPELVWTVTDFDPGSAFTWRATSPGVTSVGTHRMIAVTGGVRVTLGLRQTGVLAPIVGLFTGARTRRYVQIEAAGLKQRCETREPAMTGGM